MFSRRFLGVFTRFFCGNHRFHGILLSKSQDPRWMIEQSVGLFQGLLVPGFCALQICLKVFIALGEAFLQGFPSDKHLLMRGCLEDILESKKQPLQRCTC